MAILRTFCDIFGALRQKRAVFLISSGLIFLVSYGLLFSIDLVPESPAVSQSEFLAGASIELGADDEDAGPVDDRPIRIIADAINLDASIVNPESRDINALDEALRRGVVHYPGSGNLEDRSNMLFFGHSSYLPHVQNEWYRVFNNLSQLAPGDMVRVQADGYEYHYAVSEVVLVDADKALVEFSTQEKKLTLSTCNSFGAKTERFVVEADYIGRVPLSEHKT
jgi:LPXTG-site transpeptidase (sortase) family protein